MFTVIVFHVYQSKNLVMFLGLINVKNNDVKTRDTYGRQEDTAAETLCYNLTH